MDQNHTLRLGFTTGQDIYQRKRKWYSFGSKIHWTLLLCLMFKIYWLSCMTFSDEEAWWISVQRRSQCDQLGFKKRRRNDQLGFKNEDKLQSLCHQEVILRPNIMKWLKFPSYEGHVRSINEETKMVTKTWDKCVIQTYNKDYFWQNKKLWLKLQHYANHIDHFCNVLFCK